MTVLYTQFNSTPPFGSKAMSFELSKNLHSTISPVVHELIVSRANTSVYKQRHYIEWLNKLRGLRLDHESSLAFPSSVARLRMEVRPSARCRWWKAGSEFICSCDAGVVTLSGTGFEFNCSRDAGVVIAGGPSSVTFSSGPSHPFVLN